MSSTFDVKSLPLHRQIALIGGGLLFISLFFPWWRASVDFGALGSGGGSVSGWNGVGTLIGLLAILIVAWEVLRMLGQAAQIKFNHDLVTAALAGLITLFGLIQFIRALTYGGGGGPGVSTGPHIGAFLILVCSLALGYAAYLAYQAAGGQSALKEAQSQVQNSRSASAEPAAPDAAPPAAPDAAPPAAPAAEAAPPAPPAETAPEVAPEGSVDDADDEHPPSTPTAG